MTKTCWVRDAFSGYRGRYLAYADENGDVLVWDSVAGHYTTCHSLTRSQCERVRRLTQPGRE